MVSLDICSLATSNCGNLQSQIGCLWLCEYCDLWQGLLKTSMIRGGGVKVYSTNLHLELVKVTHLYKFSTLVKLTNLVKITNFLVTLYNKDQLSNTHIKNTIIDFTQF